MKIIFNNGTELEYTFALKSNEFYNNAKRECIAVKCDSATVSLDALNTILSDEANLETITLVGEADGQEIREILSNYVIKMELALKPEIVEAETSESEAVYAEVINFKLGARTYIEQQLHNLGL